MNTVLAHLDLRNCEIFEKNIEISRTADNKETRGTDKIWRAGCGSADRGDENRG